MLTVRIGDRKGAINIDSMLRREGQPRRAKGYVTHVSASCLGHEKPSRSLALPYLQKELTNLQ